MLDVPRLSNDGYYLTAINTTSCLILKITTTTWLCSMRTVTEWASTWFTTTPVTCTQGSTSIDWLGTIKTQSCQWAIDPYGQVVNRKLCLLVSARRSVRTFIRFLYEFKMNCLFKFRVYNMPIEVDHFSYQYLDKELPWLMFLTLEKSCAIQ